MGTSVAPLFIPGHMNRLRDKAQELNLDSILVDLEDAVPESEKDLARSGAIDLVRRLPGRCHVRVNSLEVAPSRSACRGNDDIFAVVVPGLVGIVAPKIESGDALLNIDEVLTKAERDASLDTNSIELGATIETAAGLVNLTTIARVGLKRPLRLSFGMADFTADLGIQWTRDETECAVARAWLPIVSRAAGLRKPRDSVFIDVNDLEGLRASALRGKQLGYGGKSAIHPKQIPIIKEVYRPTEDEVLWARTVLSTAAEKAKTGHGAFLLDGKMVDEPIVARARGVIADYDNAL
jgi:citrate lyase beta subunit